MSNIGKVMKEKGYTPLADDGRVGVGFAAKLGQPNASLPRKVWFDTGLKMSDGKTPRTVSATDQVGYNECIGKGWKPINPGEPTAEVKSGDEVKSADVIVKPAVSDEVKPPAKRRGKSKKSE